MPFTNAKKQRATASVMLGLMVERRVFKCCAVKPLCTPRRPYGLVEERSAKAERRIVAQLKPKALKTYDGD